MNTKTEGKELAHLCDANHCPDAQVLFEKINVSQSTWVLYETWLIQEASDSGSMCETLSSHTLLISFCPFCGVELEKIKASIW